MNTSVMSPVVKTRSGEVRGSVTDGVNTFKGIPYAAPPFGANRLRPPQPVTPWSGVREALTFGPKPPQPAYPPEVSAVLPELASPGEDCLNLNIWTPDLGSARLPVMVWLPGSAFQYGTAATTYYDGGHFARDGGIWPHDTRHNDPCRARRLSERNKLEPFAMSLDGGESGLRPKLATG